MNRIAILAASALISASFPAFSKDTEEGKGKLSFYGEISNLANYTSRVGISDEQGLFYLVPSDKNLNQVGIDLNTQPSLRYLNLASRLGMGWNGYESGLFKLNAKIEADFYCQQASNVSLHLRHAYFDAAFDFGRFRTLKVLAGQTWHPFAENAPHTFMISRGAPFNPYCLAPQLRLSYDPIENLDVSFSALWQNEGKSLGPDGYSTKYIEWSMVPEMCLTVSYRYKGLYAKAGANLLTIKPRITGIYPFTEVEVHVNDKITNFSAFLYGEYEYDKLSVRAKTTYANSGEHMMLMGGYSLSHGSEEGTYYYTPYRTSSTWISARYGNKLNASLMLGYIQNLGTPESIYGTSDYIFFRGDAWNMKRALQVSPCGEFSWKHLIVGLEYSFTMAQYESWTANHMVTVQLGCRF